MAACEMCLEDLVRSQLTRVEGAFSILGRMGTKSAESHGLVSDSPEQSA